MTSKREYPAGFDELVRAARTRDLPVPAECRRLRERNHLTQAELAAAAGVGRPAVTKWEAGTRRPRGAARDRYAAILAALRDTA